MKNIENFNLSELTKNKLSSIAGGGLFRDLGRLAGKAWCEVKNGWTRYNEMRQTAYDNGYVGPS